MAIRFILGRSGTGKTSYCIRSVVDALLEPGERPLILLVPEQATYQVERAILADERIAGYNRLHVLSFDRLQFLLVGKNTARPTLSRTGQQMIVHRILREHKGKLKLFGASAAWPGLSRQMARTIAELHEYAKTPDDIQQLLGELATDERNRLAVLKFSDIGLIFEEYLRFIEGNFLDPDAQLIRARRAVAASALTNGATLWVDGFAGFTTAELVILVELLKVAENAHVALCLDPSNIDLANPDPQALDAAGLFNPTQRTYGTLIEIIRKNKLKLAEPAILGETVRFSCCPQLAHVERHVFMPDAPRIPASGNVRIVSAPDERTEVHFVVRQILQLVKEKDFRYRDIAVIASDIGLYEHYIRAYFDDYGVPFFIDKRRPLNHHPVLQLIFSALRVVTGGFSHGDVFAHLKTDLVPVERYDVDSLENYCLAFGISAGDWQSDKPWRFAGAEDEQFDERRIDRVRTKVSRPLLELQSRLCPGGGAAQGLSAEQFTRAVFNFLDNLEVRRTMGRWIQEAVEKNDRTTADEHQQFYGRFVDIFDELVEVFAGHTMTAEDYLAVISSAFSQLTLAFIPPTLDQVLVGSIERSRHPDLKAVFLIGATQRQFPVPIVQDSILTDADRSAAESADFLLAAGPGQSLAERQYLAYIAYTRPSEFLCVAYPSVDDKGAAVPRSQFMDDLESLFDDLGEESIAGRPVDVEQVHNEIELADLLCSRLGRDITSPGAGDTSQYGELLEDICSDEQLAELGSGVLSALQYDNRAQLSEDVVERLFGRRIQSSATRLSTFAACPYQHFARYVLELREREEFKFEPLDLGAFYHRVLDALVKRLNVEERDIASADDGVLLTILREVTAEVVREDAFISNFVSRRGYNEFIIHSAGEILEDCVLAIAQMVRAGRFRPILSEVSFGRVKDSRDTLGEYELVLPDGRVLSLDGKIDRLDCADVDGEEVGLVFDYKRRDTSFNWSKLYHGLDMQLPIYMSAARNATRAKTRNVAGAFYMPIEVAPAKAALTELSERADRFDYRARGVFNGKYAQQLDGTVDAGWSRFYNFRLASKDGQYANYAASGALKPNDFERLLRLTEWRMLRLAREIVSGRIEVQPYRLGTESPCSVCSFRSVCRFDWQINDYNLLESLGKLEVLEKAEVADG